MKSQPEPKVTARWNAGETGCSGLIVGVRERIGRMNDGETLEITVRNTGASIDLLVWCRMTGHRLIAEAPPRYVIRKVAG